MAAHRCSCSLPVASRSSRARMGIRSTVDRARTGIHTVGSGHTKTRTAIRSASEVPAAAREARRVEGVEERKVTYSGAAAADALEQAPCAPCSSSSLAGTTAAAVVVCVEELAFPGGGGGGGHRGGSVVSGSPRRSTMADHLDRLPGSSRGLVRPVVSVLTNPLVRAVAEAFEDTTSCSNGRGSSPWRKEWEVSMDDEEDGGVGGNGRR